MTDIPWTSLQRPIIWFPGRTATCSRRRPVDAPVENIWIFVLPVKNWNRYVIFFFFSFLYWSPETLLKVPCRYRTLGPLRDLQGTSSGRRVPAADLYLTTFDNRIGLKNNVNVFLKEKIIDEKHFVFNNSIKIWRLLIIK